MKHLLTVFTLACALLSSGCLIDTDGLQKVVAGLKELESKANDDAKEHIDKLHKGVEGLIRQAEASGGRLEEKVLRDFIEQRRETIIEVLKTYDQIHGKS